MPNAIDHEPCPRCGKQPVATKGKTYWTARCEESKHVMHPVAATPMRTKVAALEAWDEDVKYDRIG